MWDSFWPSIAWIMKVIFSAFIIDWMNKHDCNNKDKALCQIWHTMKMAERSCCHGRKTKLHGRWPFNVMWGMKWNSCLLRSGTDECFTSSILPTTCLCKVAAYIFVSSRQILASGWLGQIGRLWVALRPLVPVLFDLNMEFDVLTRSPSWSLVG